ncbi:signal peptide peptidase SppA [Candidatus Sumerlaeota bacterium]|nr:signal peptide peptidase SppA [Candidatus Sumerlaeota bacterium]
MNIRRHYIWLATAIGIMLILQGCVVMFGPELLSLKSRYKEITVQKADHFYTLNKILLVDVSGIITKGYGSSFFQRGVEKDLIADVKEALERAKKDHAIKAVVLRIDSPGGLVSWCNVLYREIKKFKEESQKPVVASIISVGASGGYFVSLAADKIYLSPGGITGSIGVVAVFLNLKELADKIGVQTQIIKSGAKKDMGSLWRSLTDEERQILQQLIDEYYQRFLDAIVENRPDVKLDKLLPFADGRIFSDKQAEQLGLIDGVAYLDEVIDKTKELTGIKDARVVTYYRRFEYKNNIYSQFAPGFPETPSNTTVNLINFGLGSMTPLEPGFYYLWLPGGGE